MFRILTFYIAFVAVVLVEAFFYDGVSTQGRIVRGFNAAMGARPFHVSLRTTGDKHFCSGSIINNRWILTAAQCTNKRAQNSVRIVVGTIFLDSGGDVYNSSRIIVHHLYNSKALANDVSVIQTSTTINFNIYVTSILLATYTTGGGVTAQFSGWEDTSSSDGGISSNQLKTLNTTTLTNTDCREQHTSVNSQFVFEHNICTFTQFGSGVCERDFGGGLTAGRRLIGIASWNIPCARGFPDAFERVYYYRAWILNAIAS